MAHKLNKEEFDARKQVRDELKKPRGTINNIPQLAARVEKLEQALGLTPPIINNVAIN